MEKNYSFKKNSGLNFKQFILTLIIGFSSFIMVGQVSEFRHIDFTGLTGGNGGEASYPFNLYNSNYEFISFRAQVIQDTYNIPQKILRIIAPDGTVFNLDTGTEYSFASGLEYSSGDLRPNSATETGGLWTMVVSQPITQNTQPSALFRVEFLFSYIYHPPIIANNDVSPNAIEVGIGGTAISNVLANDNLGGSVPTTSTVTLSKISATHAGISLSTSGAVTVSSSVPAGNHTLTYRICEKADGSNCDTAIVYITTFVLPMTANDDISPNDVVEGIGGVAIANVLANDDYNGSVPTASDVSLSEISTTNPGFKLNTSTGEVTVSPTVTPGDHTLVYEMCQLTNPTNCKTATVTVTVVSDTDGDGIIDSADSAPSNPCSPVQLAGYTGYDATNSIWAAGDCDSDGITNLAEVGGGTDPYNVDTDEDGNPDNLDINPTNPTATDDVMNAVQNTLATYNILANDDYLSNSDGNNLGTVVLTNLGTGSAVGTVVFDANTGNMSYTPVSGEEGTSVTVDYQVCNGAVCATATVVINVSNDIDGDGISNSTDLDDDNDGNPDVTDPHPLDAIAQNDFMNALEEVATDYNILSNDDFLAGATTLITDTGAGTATGTISFNGATGVMTYTPASGEEGTLVTVIYQVCNDVNGDSPGATTDDVCATATVVITVTEVNDIPSFTKGANQVVSEDAGPQTVVGWATAISAGKNNANVDNEVGQGLTFVVTNNTNNLFSVQPTVSASGELTYTPALNAVGTATVSVTLTDDGGTANGGVNTTAAQTFTITINAVNDAPVLIPQYYNLGTITEDAPSTGITVASVVGSSISDPDTGAIEGIAIYNTVGNGDWQYYNGSAWVTISGASVDNALLLVSTAQIRFNPNLENGETATFSYYAWDQTVGSAGSFANATTRGGTTTFSVDGDTATINVLDVNDAPLLVAAAPTYTTDENTPIEFTLADLIGSSITDVDNNALEGIAVYNTSATLGTLQYSIDSGVWVDFPTNTANIALLLPSTANIKYIPNNLSGETVTFNYYAWDQTTGVIGTTANIVSRGGITAFSTNSDTATITVDTLPDDSVIALTKVVSAGPYNVGNNVTFTVTVINNGPENATGIDVVDQLSSGYTYVSSSTAFGTYDSNSGLWDIGSLSVYDTTDAGTIAATTATLTVVATINATGNYTNSAEVTHVDQLDPNGVEHGNNTPSEIDQDEVTIVPVSIIDLVTTKTVDNATPNIGDEITYTLSVVNNGPSDATGVVVTDNLPVGVTYTGHLATGGNVNTYSSGSWNVGTILSGTSANLIITATIDSDQGGKTIRNEITEVSSNETDLSPTIDDATAIVIVTSSDLVTTKVVSDSTPDEGDTIVYTIAVTNSGSDATNVSLTDLLPAGVTYVSDDQGGSYNSGSGIWTIGNIANGATATLNITATVDAGTAGQTITNTTTAATGDQSDPTTDGDDLSESITVNNGTDIVLTKVVDNATPNTGDTVTYTLVVTNNGPALATNIVVTDVLPAGVVEANVSPSTGLWVSSNWTFPSLAVGESETMIIEAVVIANGTLAQTPIINSAFITLDQIDLTGAGDPQTAAITVTASDLVTTKVVSDSTPDEGDTIVYTIAVTNNGPSDATGISLTDLLPAGVTYVSDDQGGSYNSGSGKWTIGAIADNATATLNITATVDAGTAGQTITNTTTAATGDQSDPTTVNDVLFVDIDVNNALDIVMVKTVDNATPNTGDTITYSIVVTNNGPALATNLVITDVLPSGVSFGTASPTIGTWNAGVWTIGNLVSGASESITIDAVVTATGTLPFTTLTNTATHSQDQDDITETSPGDDEATADIQVTATDLETNKTVSDSTPYEGQIIVYTITVTNESGTNPATGVSLTDLLPIGVTYVSDDSNGAYNSGSGIWTIGNVTNGSPEVLNISAKVNSGTANSTITNLTTAAKGNQTDPISADDLDAIIAVENYSDIVLTKVVDNATPNSGDIVTYTITVTNNGPSEVTGLVVTDALPAGLAEGLVTPSAGSWTSPLWIIGTLGVGATETMTIEALVTALGEFSQPDIVNIATNAQDQNDSSLPSEASSTINVTSTDLVTIKSVNDATPYEGQTIVYSIVVTNYGPSDATGVSLVDLLPDGVTYVSDNQGENYNSGDGNWNIGTLASGDSITLEIRASVDALTSGDTILNTTTAASGDQTDPDTATEGFPEDDLDAIITVENYSDIVLTKVVDNVTPNVGDTVTYTVTVRNNGPAKVTGLVVTDAFPTGLTYGIVSPSDGTWTTPDWNVGTLASGEEETIVIEAVVGMDQGGQTLTNTVSNSQDQLDSDLTADDDSETIVVTSADLVTVKTVSNAIPNEGATITYTIAVTNNGPSDATGVSLTDLLPIGVTYISDDQSGAYNSGSGIWTIGAISSSATATLNITVTVDADTAGTSITNATTAATGDQSDPTTAGDILEATIVVENYADIVLTKVVDNAMPNVGDTVTYTVTVRNNGPAKVTGLVVTDAFPTGLTYGIVSPSDGTWTTPDWNVGTLASGEEETIVIEAVVGMDQGGQTLTNTVSNSQDQVDSDLTADDASETIVVTSSDLVTVKTVSNETPNEGTIITYTIAVTNNGPSTATNVSLIDNLPVGVTYVSHSTANGVFNFGSGEWSIGEIENGATATIEIEASVDYETVGQTITNTTSAVIADQSDPDKSNNVGSVSIVPTAFIDLSLTKVVVGDLEDLEVGDMVTFEIRVANQGPTEATGVQVTDMIPSGYAYLGVYSSSIGTYDAATGIWDIGFIEIGNTAVLLVDVKVLDTGDYTNCAEITGANEIDVDSTPNNGDTTEDDYDCASAAPVQALDLRIEKSVIADNLTPMVGDEVSFEIRLINDGDIEGTDVVVTDLLPSGYTYLNYSSSRGTYDDDTGLWIVGTVVDEETEILIVDAIVNATGDYLNCATITAMHQVDPDVSNNTSCIATDPIPVADLELTKDVDVYEPYAETNVDFTINLTNNGPSDATRVQVRDLLPSGYNFVSASTTVGTYDEGSGIWNVGNVLIDETETLVVTAYVLPIGEWTNVAEVIASNELDLDSTPGNNDTYEDDQDEQKTEPIVLVTIAEGFSPNGDGINDVFEIEFLEVLYPNFGMEIVDRYGNKVYEYKHNGNPYQTPDWWNGFSGGKMNLGSNTLPPGTYFYSIYFNNNERKPQNGWVYLRK